MEDTEITDVAYLVVDAPVLVADEDFPGSDDELDPKGLVELARLSEQ